MGFFFFFLTVLHPAFPLSALNFHNFTCKILDLSSKDISEEVAAEKTVDMVERKRRNLPTATQSGTSQLTEVQGMCIFLSYL